MLALTVAGVTVVDLRSNVRCGTTPGYWPPYGGNWGKAATRREVSSRNWQSSSGRRQITPSRNSSICASFSSNGLIVSAMRATQSRSLALGSAQGPSSVMCAWANSGSAETNDES